MSLREGQRERERERLATDDNCSYIFLLLPLFRPKIFPSLCLGVSNFDLGLDAANTASTAFAAAKVHGCKNL